MLGYVIWHAQGGIRPAVERRMLAQVLFQVWEAAPARTPWQRRRLRQTGELLVRSGVRQVAVERDTPPELLQRFGLEEVDCGALRLAGLKHLLTFAAAHQQVALPGSCVALRAAQVNARVIHAARILACCSRRITLDVGAGQEELERLLRWEYGLVPGGTPELQLCVSCPAQPALPALHIGRDCHRRQKILWDYPELPQAGESLLSAIFQAKKGKIKDIRVKSVEFSA